jgi:hypothetical protein
MAIFCVSAKAPPRYKLGGNMRLLAGIILALLVGLLAARIPSMGESESSFSWFGFVGGVAIVSLASGIGRILAPAAADAKTRVRLPLQRWMLASSLSAGVVALASFVLLLYAPWQWPRYVVMLGVVVGALSVFISVATAWLGPKHGA